jgi:hypothetical protein
VQKVGFSQGVFWKIDKTQKRIWIFHLCSGDYAQSRLSSSLRSAGREQRLPKRLPVGGGVDDQEREETE